MLRTAVRHLTMAADKPESVAAAGDSAVTPDRSAAQDRRVPMGAPVYGGRRAAVNCLPKIVGNLRDNP